MMEEYRRATLNPQYGDRSSTVTDSGVRSRASSDMYTTSSMLPEQNQSLSKVLGDCRKAGKHQNDESDGEDETEDKQLKNDEESPCCTCKKQCWTKFSLSERHKIYTEFWALASDKDKSRWLQKCVRGRAYVIYGDGPKQRGLYKKYQFMSQTTGSMVKVCSPFFRATLGLSTPALLNLLEDTCGPDGRPTQSQDSNSDYTRHKTQVANNGAGDSQDASGAGEDFRSLEINFDLNDQIAVLCIKQALQKESRLLNDIPEKQGSALILDKFNQTYPMHTMNMAQFLPIYRRVFAELKRPATSGSHGSQTYYGDEGTDNETGHKGFRDEDPDSVEQKVQRAVRDRVKRLKQHALDMQVKINARDGERRPRRVKGSTMRILKGRLHSLKVLRFKHKHPMLPACDCTVRNCKTKIPEEQRQVIHETFWNLVSVPERKSWILGNVERLLPAEYTMEHFFRRKKYVKKRYFLPDSGGERVEVCRLFFIHTLGFKWDSLIDYIIQAKPPVTQSVKTPQKRPPRWLPDYIVGSIEKYITSAMNYDKVSETIENVASSATPGNDERSNTKSITDIFSGKKVKDLYYDYKEKHQSMQFNLGYHSFRRICENVLYGKQAGSHEQCSSDMEDASMQQCFDQGSFNNTVNVSKKSVSTSTSPPSGKSDNDNWILDVNSGILKSICNKGTSTLEDSAQQSVKQKANKCLLDVGRAILKTESCSVSMQLPATGMPRKKNNRPLSKYNDKTYHPVLPPCKCAKKCFEKITEQRRQGINDEFWALPTYNERKQWMNEHIERRDVKERRVMPSQASKRTFKKTESRTYYLPDILGRLIGVCRRFYLGTLGYKWDSVIGTLTRTTGREDDHVTPDMRGRGPPRHKISEDALLSVVKYCESVCILHRDLYKMKSLESLARFGKPYNVGLLRNYGLTVLQLFKDYKSKHANQKLSYSSFQRVFKRVHAAIVLSDHENFEDMNSLTMEINMDTEFDALGAGPSEAVSDDEQDEMEDWGGQNEGQGSDSDSNGYAMNETGRAHQAMGKPVFPRDFQVQQKGTGHSYQGQPQNPRNIPGDMSLPMDQINVSSSHNSASQFYPPRFPGGEGASNEQPIHHTGHLGMSFSSLLQSPQSSHFSTETTGASSDFQRQGGYAAQLSNVNSQNSDLLGQTLYPRGPLQYPSLMGQPRNDHTSIPSCHASSDGRLDFTHRLPGAFPSFDGLNQSLYPNPAPFAAHQQPHTSFPSFPNTQTPDGGLTSIGDHGGMPFGSFPNFGESCSVPTNMSVHNMFLKTDKLGQVSETAVVTTKSSKGTSKSHKGKGSKSSTSKNPYDYGPGGKKDKKGIRPISARNCGENYPMLGLCNCTKFKCPERFSEEERQVIHDNFWSLGSYNNRKQWLLLHIKRTDPKRRRVDSLESPKKGETRFYYLPQSKIAGDVLEVCKTFFLRTLGYRWDKVIDTLRRTTPRGDIVSMPDMRGKNTPAHKLSPVIYNSVKDYVRSMWQSANLSGNLVYSHSAMSGAGRGKVPHASSAQGPYGLTVKDMYEDYKNKHGDHKVSLKVFRKIYQATDLNSSDISESGTFEDLLDLN